MRVVIQRVSTAAVDVDGTRIAEIGKGLLILAGVTDGDSADDARFLAGKIANLRIFPDDDGRMNRSALECGYAAIVVSQFTLYGDARKGRRPSFVRAATPDVAEPLVDMLAGEIRQLGVPVGTGQFGAEMHVSLVNDGPVTIWMDTKEMRG